MKSLLTVILISFSSFLIAQQSDSLAKVFAETINVEDLEKHLKKLTSDEFEGRETGKKGQLLAAEYLQKTFTSFGIPPLETGRYYQRFPLIEQNQSGVSLMMGDQKMEVVESFYPAYGLLQNNSIKSKLFFAGYGWESDSVADQWASEVEGKIVLLLVPEGKARDSWSFKKIEEIAINKGAAALMLVDPNFERNKDRIKHRLERDIVKLAEQDVYKKIPSIYIHPDVVEQATGTKYAKLTKMVSKGKKTNETIDQVFAIEIERNTNITSSQNVLGYVEGTDLKEELIIVTAHYDHLGIKNDKIYYGADDDGSGTAALLEMAQAFMLAKEKGVKFRRSILFMPVSGEEKGLLGSKYYSENPVFPLEQTITNLNIDMIGRHDKAHKEGERYVYLIGSNRLSQELHKVSEEVNKTYVNLDLDYTFNDPKDPNRYYYRSDHYNFARKNVPVIFYFSGVHVDYHKPTDTIDKINFDLLQERTRLVFYTAWELANRANRPKLDSAD